MDPKFCDLFFSWALVHSDLPPKAQLFLAYVALETTRCAEPDANQGGIASALNMSIPSVKRAVKLTKKLGLIKIHSWKQRIYVGQREDGSVESRTITLRSYPLTPAGEELTGVKNLALWARRHSNEKRSKL